MGQSRHPGEEIGLLWGPLHAALEKQGSCSVRPELFVAAA